MLPIFCIKKATDSFPGLLIMQQILKRVMGIGLQVMGFKECLLASISSNP